MVLKLETRHMVGILAQYDDGLITAIEARDKLVEVLCAVPKDVLEEFFNELVGLTPG